MTENLEKEFIKFIDSHIDWTLYKNAYKSAISQSIDGKITYIQTNAINAKPQYGFFATPKDLLYRNNNIKKYIKDKLKEKNILWNDIRQFIAKRDLAAFCDNRSYKYETVCLLALSLNLTKEEMGKAFSLFNYKIEQGIDHHFGCAFNFYIKHNEPINPSVNNERFIEYWKFADKYIRNKLGKDFSKLDDELDLEEYYNNIINERRKKLIRNLLKKYGKKDDYKKMIINKFGQELQVAKGRDIILIEDRRRILKLILDLEIEDTEEARKIFEEAGIFIGRNNKEKDQLFNALDLFIVNKVYDKSFSYNTNENIYQLVDEFKSEQTDSYKYEILYYTLMYETILQSFCKRNSDYIAKNSFDYFLEDFFICLYENDMYNYETKIRATDNSSIFENQINNLLFIVFIKQLISKKENDSDVFRNIFDRYKSSNVVRCILRTIVYENAFSKNAFETEMRKYTNMNNKESFCKRIEDYFMDIFNYIKDNNSNTNSVIYKIYQEKILNHEELIRQYAINIYNKFKNWEKENK